MRKLSKNNTTLTESINTNLILPTQNKTDFINSGHHEKENKDLNLTIRNNIIIKCKNEGSQKEGK